MGQTVQNVLIIFQLEIEEIDIFLNHKQQLIKNLIAEIVNTVIVFQNTAHGIRNREVD